MVLVNFFHLNLSCWINEVGMLLLPLSQPFVLGSLSLRCRCDCDRQALMTALHACRWSAAEWFLLNTDVASASGARASLLGSLSAGHRLKTKTMKRIVDEDDDDVKVFLHLREPGRAEERMGGEEKSMSGLSSVVVFFLTAAAATGPNSLKPLEWYWNAADGTRSRATPVASNLEQLREGCWPGTRPWKPLWTLTSFSPPGF